MTVAGMGENEVIDGGIKDYQPGEKPCPGPFLAQCADKSPECEDGCSQKCRTSEVNWGKAVGRPGDTIPEVKKPFEADDRETAGMSANPVEGEAFALGGVGEFTHALKFFEFEFVEIGLEVRHEHAIGGGAVAKSELQSEIVADEDEVSKDFVVADEPGRQY